MYEQLARIALEEFADIIVAHESIGRRAATSLKLRLSVRDGTFIDIWLSPDIQRYSYHWEQRSLRGLLHRHDNSPDHPEITTFPKHFHNGSEEAVEPSHMSDEPDTAIREFLAFVRKRLAQG